VAFAQKTKVKKVAVFDPTGDISLDIKDIVREEISNIIVNTAGYTVLERSLYKEELLTINSINVNSEDYNSQICNICLNIGAHYALTTTISYLGNNLYISCKFINVINSRIEKQKTGKTNDGINDIDIVIRDIINEMILTEAPQTTAIPTETDIPAKSKITLVLSGKTIFAQNCGCNTLLSDIDTKYAYDDIVLPEGWRMATINELQCMCRFQKRIGGFKSEFYWSAEKKGEDDIYGVTFDDCKVEHRKKVALKKTNLFYTKFVKTGSNEPAFTPLIDNFSNCNCKIENVDKDAEYGYNEILPPDGWRLPSVKELECMCKNQKSIGGLHQDFYWSNELKQAGEVIGVTFNDCKKETRDINSKGYVRLVQDK
jgi:hypothetical protein